MSSPAAVSSVRATSTPRSIHLFWKEPVSNGSVILSYNIDVGDQRPLLFVDADTLDYIITDLMPETAYKYDVSLCALSLLLHEFLLFTSRSAVGLAELIGQKLSVCLCVNQGGANHHESTTATRLN